MKWIFAFFFFLVAFVFGSLFALPAIVTSSEDRFKTECLDTFVSVEVPGALGSGVLIKPGYVLTAFHVIRQREYTCVGGIIRPTKRLGKTIAAEKIKCVGHERGRRIEYSVDYVPYSDGPRDLAVLKLKTNATPACRWDRGIKLTVGEPCYYVGNPDGLRKLTEKSIISATHFEQWDREFTITGGFGWYGNSGGPLYVLRGGHFYLSGICQAGWPDYPKTPVAFATIESIREVLFSARIPRVEDGDVP